MPCLLEKVHEVCRYRSAIAVPDVYAPSHVRGVPKVFGTGMADAIPGKRALAKEEHIPAAHRWRMPDNAGQHADLLSVRIPLRAFRRKAVSGWAYWPGRSAFMSVAVSGGRHRTVGAVKIVTAPCSRQGRYRDPLRRSGDSKHRPGPTTDRSKPEHDHSPFLRGQGAARDSTPILTVLADDLR